MDNLILILVSVLSLAGMLALLGWRVIYNRRHQVDYTRFGDYSILHLIVDYAAFRIVLFFKQIIAKSYLFTIFFLQNCLSLIRYVIIHLEKRFHKFTESLRKNQVVIHNNGAVSSFLREIKDHKENFLSEVGDKIDYEEEVISVSVSEITDGELDK